jgi:hypothetical protein
MPTREQYEAAFETERRNEYPVIDEFEKRMGFAVDRERLEAAARVLACPVKKNPPNWQHGRVIYALARVRLASKQDGAPDFWWDIGTAKGFSAACMVWAVEDDTNNHDVYIHTCDVIKPKSSEPRNSIFDGEASTGVFDYFMPFIKAGAACINATQVGDEFYQQHLKHDDRIAFAFIDGSHTYEGVKADIALVTPRQQTGDIILFDDVNKEQVNRAVREMEGYDLEYIRLLPQRAYAIAVKR